MDTKKLSAFLKVVESGSFSKAANELNYTQSGITHMIRSLEKETGIDLFLRDYNGVRLTADGERLVPFIKKVVEKYNNFEAEINNISTNNERTLFIGAYSSIAIIWLPEITRRFRDKYPNITLEFSHYSVEGMRNAIKSGEIDIGFGSHPPQSEFMWVDLHNDPLLAILPKDYKLSGNEFNIKDFDQKEFLMPSYGFDEDILKVLYKNGVSPAIKPTSVDDSVIVSMVGCNLGLSILSELVMRTGNFNEVSAVKLSPAAYRTLGVAIMPQNAHKKYIRDFIKISEQYISEIYKKD